MLITTDTNKTSRDTKHILSGTIKTIGLISTFGLAVLSTPHLLQIAVSAGISMGDIIVMPAFALAGFGAIKGTFDIISDAVKGELTARNGLKTMAKNILVGAAAGAAFAPAMMTSGMFFPAGIFFTGLAAGASKFLIDFTTESKNVTWTALPATIGLGLAGLAMAVGIEGLNQAHPEIVGYAATVAHGIADVGATIGQHVLTLGH